MKRDPVMRVALSALILGVSWSLGFSMDRPKVEILGMTVIKNLPDTLILGVEVQNHSDEPATVDCIDTYLGKSTGYWRITKKTIHTGRHVYETSIGLNPEAAPDRHESDGLLCQVFPATGAAPRTLAQKYFPFKKSWAYTPPNRISDIRVVDAQGEKIDVEVDYTYSGDHGRENIYIDCHPYTDDWFTPFGMTPATVMIGTHTARTEMSSFEGTPANIVSTKIQCVMNSRKDQWNFTKKMIPYRKVWKPHSGK